MFLLGDGSIYLLRDGSKSLGDEYPLDLHPCGRDRENIKLTILDMITICDHKRMIVFV